MIPSLVAIGLDRLRVNLPKYRYSRIVSSKDPRCVLACRWWRDTNHHSSGRDEIYERWNLLSSKLRWRRWDRLSWIFLWDSAKDRPIFLDNQPLQWCWLLRRFEPGFAEELCTSTRPSLFWSLFDPVEKWRFLCVPPVLSIRPTRFWPCSCKTQLLPVVSHLQQMHYQSIEAAATENQVAW